MRTGRLTDLALIAALAISSATFTVLLPKRLETGQSLLIVFMTLSIVAAGLVTRRWFELRAPDHQATRPEAPRPLLRGSRHGNPPLVPAEDSVATDEDCSVSVLLDSELPIPAPTPHDGQVEIRPGVWAYEEGVPPEVLLRHLERRRAEAHHTPA